jgi:hypothetical protein
MSSHEAMEQYVLRQSTPAVWGYKKTCDCEDSRRMPMLSLHFESMVVIIMAKMPMPNARLPSLHVSFFKEDKNLKQ